jgi:(2S)-methylsuccinyl-CoA dehydrogenase
MMKTNVPTVSFEDASAAIAAAERLLHFARVGVRASVTAANGLDGAQTAAHGFAWLATYVEGLRQMLGWARRLTHESRLGEIEHLLLTAAFGEYLAQISGGIPMNQGETVRVAALGVPRTEIADFSDATTQLVEVGTSEQVKSRIAALIASQPQVTTFGDTALDDTLTAMREQIAKFASTEVLPYAHGR